VGLERVRQTTLSIGGPSTVGYKKTGKLTGLLFDSGVGPIARAKVAVQAMPAGSTSWRTLAHVTTDAGGRWTKSVTPTRRTKFRAVYSGSPNAYLGTTSGSKTVTPRASLTAPTAPKRIARNRYFTTTGYLKPRPGPAPVKIKAYKYDSAKRRYVLKKTYSAKLTRHNSTTSKYSARVRFTSRGTWKLVASTLPSIHAVATTSSGRYSTVR
jgi:hypothetical protein